MLAPGVPAVGAGAACQAAFLFDAGRPAHPLLFFRLAGDLPPARVAQSDTLLGTRTATSHGRPGWPDEARAALATLIGLGVNLPIAFTAAELRRQYRRLARRIHPDRHPTAPEPERRRLSHAFAAASDSYRVLSNLESLVANR